MPEPARRTPSKRRAAEAVISFIGLFLFCCRRAIVTSWCRRRGG
jgi:DNA-directed RNA polymerase subunit N (RpoN/RPB10)